MTSDVTSKFPWCYRASLERGFRCSIWWSTRWGSQLSSSRLGRCPLTEMLWGGFLHLTQLAKEDGKVSLFELSLNNKIREAFKALPCRKTETPFGRDSVWIWERPAVSPILGPHLRFTACNSDFRGDIWIILLNVDPDSFSERFYSKGSLNPLKLFLLSQTQTLPTSKKYQGSNLGNDGRTLPQRSLWQLIIRKFPPSLGKHMPH